MFKRIGIIGLILIISLSFVLKAEVTPSISWNVEIHSAESGVSWVLYYKTTDGERVDAFSGTGSGIINRTLYFGHPVGVRKMGAEAQSEHYFDSVEKYESSHLEAELWLGIAPDPDPGTPGTD